MVKAVLWLAFCVLAIPLLRILSFTNILSAENPHGLMHSYTYRCTCEFACYISNKLQNNTYRDW